MARPVKNGLLYYPMDCNHFEDRKIKELIYNYKSNGYMFYQYILSRIYSNGYYLQFSPDEIFDIAWFLKIEEDDVIELLEYSLNFGLFDQYMFDNFRILTNLEIQERWTTIIRKSKRKAKIIKRYDLSKHLETEAIKVSNNPQNNLIQTTESEILPNCYLDCICENILLINEN